jgi:hypothetical protein
MIGSRLSPCLAPADRSGAVGALSRPHWAGLSAKCARDTAGMPGHAPAIRAKFSPDVAGMLPRCSRNASAMSSRSNGLRLKQSWSSSDSIPINGQCLFNAATSYRLKPCAGFALIHSLPNGALPRFSDLPPFPIPVSSELRHSMGFDIQSPRCL